MTTSTASRRTSILPELPPDPGLPGVRGLFDGAGVGAAARFLADRGWELEEARAVQSLYRPGRSCVVRYRVRATEPAGGRRSLSLCVEARARHRDPAPPSPEAEQRSGLPEPVGRQDPYVVWALPYDPNLPGLARSLWGPSIRATWDPADERPSAVWAQLHRYRPRRRAVVRYRALRLRRGRREWEDVFGKVLPAAAAERGWRTAARLGSARRASPARLALPTARGPGEALLLPAMPGRSMREILVGGGALPRPDRVASLVDDLPAWLERLGLGDGAGPDHGHEARWAADLLMRLRPDRAGDIARVVDAVATGAAADDLPCRPVHGDLYEAQVFVADDYSLGLIDLDGVGPGDPAMEAATFSGHLLALALSAPAARRRVLGYRSLLRDAFLARLGIPSSALVWREALVMLQLAMGPFRVLDPGWPEQVGRRLDVAVGLLSRAPVTP